VHLIDISLKGALVRTDTPPMLALDEKCRLVLPLANGNESISMGGSVAHLDQQHVGIKCVDIDVVNLTRLRRLIELNTGDADMVDRELSLLLQPR
jgi:hypothetical protein